eukprot:521543_1
MKENKENGEKSNLTTGVIERQDGAKLSKEKIYAMILSTLKSGQINVWTDGLVKVCKQTEKRNYLIRKSLVNRKTDVKGVLKELLANLCSITGERLRSMVIRALAQLADFECEFDSKLMNKLCETIEIQNKMVNGSLALRKVEVMNIAVELKGKQADENKIRPRSISNKCPQNLKGVPKLELPPNKRKKHPSAPKPQLDREFPPNKRSRIKSPPPKKRKVPEQNGTSENRHSLPRSPKPKNSKKTANGTGKFKKSKSAIGQGHGSPCDSRDVSNHASATGGHPKTSESPDGSSDPDLSPHASDSLYDLQSGTAKVSIPWIVRSYLDKSKSSVGGNYEMSWDSRPAVLSGRTRPLAPSILSRLATRRNPRASALVAHCARANLVGHARSRTSVLREIPRRETESTPASPISKTSANSSTAESSRRISQTKSVLSTLVNSVVAKSESPSKTHQNPPPEQFSDMDTVIKSVISSVVNSVAENPRKTSETRGGDNTEISSEFSTLFVSPESTSSKGEAKVETVKKGSVKTPKKKSGHLNPASAIKRGRPKKGETSHSSHNLPIFLRDPMAECGLPVVSEDLAEEHDLEAGAMAVVFRGLKRPVMKRSRSDTDLLSFPYVPTFPGYNKTGLFYDLHCAFHRGEADEPESPERYATTVALLESSGVKHRCVPILSGKASDEDILTVHSEELLEELHTIQNRILHPDDFCGYEEDSLYESHHTFEAVRRSVGGAIEITKKVFEGKLKNGICLSRPPGHHCNKDKRFGFCHVNNIAIAAKVVQRAHPSVKVAILDWDLHHGNGTQEIFDSSTDVLYISIHQETDQEDEPMFPGSGSISEVGDRDARGKTINLPVPRGTGDPEFRRIMDDIVLPVLTEFQADLVLVSAGFDSACGDPLGCMEVTPEMFGFMTSKLMEVADGKVVLFLEGGYNPTVTSHCVLECTKALLGDKIFYDPLPSMEPDFLCLFMDKYIYTLRRYWKCLDTLASDELPGRAKNKYKSGMKSKKCNELARIRRRNGRSRFGFRSIKAFGGASIGLPQRPGDGKKKRGRPRKHPRGGEINDDDFVPGASTRPSTASHRPQSTLPKHAHRKCPTCTCLDKKPVAPPQPKCKRCGFDEKSPHESAPCGVLTQPGLKSRWSSVDVLSVQRIMNLIRETYKNPPDFGRPSKRLKLHKRPKDAPRRWYRSSKRKGNLVPSSRIASPVKKRQKLAQKSVIKSESGGPKVPGSSAGNKAAGLVDTPVKNRSNSDKGSVSDFSEQSACKLEASTGDTPNLAQERT